MFLNVSFVAAASVAAIALSRINIPFPRKQNPLIKPPPEDEEENSADSGINLHFQDGKEEEEEEEEEDVIHERREIWILQNVAKEMERKTVALEGKLLEMYGIKEQHSCVSQLQKHLKVKTAEVVVLSMAVASLRAEIKKLLEEVKERALVEKQLESAKKRVKQLEEKMFVDSNCWARKTLLTLAQEVSGTCGTGLENVGNMNRNVELKAVEMKRRNKELELGRRGLRIMLVDAEDKVTAQIKVKDKLDDEMNNFRNANESLSKQIENLQKNRLAIIEELMYQRSLNTCLRFERQHFLNSSQESQGNKTVTPLIPNHNSYSKSSSSTSSIDSFTIDGSSSIKSESTIRRWGRRERSSRLGVSSSERCSGENSPVKAGSLVRRSSMSDVPLMKE